MTAKIITRWVADLPRYRCEDESIIVCQVRIKATPKRWAIIRDGTPESRLADEVIGYDTNFTPGHRKFYESREEALEGLKKRMEEARLSHSRKATECGRRVQEILELLSD